MKCLVCHQLIVINRFKEVLSIQSPLLCVSCQNQMIRKKGGLLFEENEWLKSVIERLNKGDIILTELFINSASKGENKGDRTKTSSIVKRKGRVIKNPPADAGNVGDEGLIPGPEDPLEKEITTHSSILA